MDHTEGRIDKLKVVEIEAPAEVGQENEQKHYEVPPSAVWHCDLPARRRLTASEDRTKGKNRERRHRQHGNASLQQFIEGKPENIEAQIDTKEWVGYSKRATVAKPEKGVPLSGDAYCKDQRENHNCEIDSEDQQPGADIDIDRLACVSGMRECFVE
jgi:hypothetical protein